MFEAEEAKLQGDEGKLPILHLPFDEGAQKTPSRVRRTYVTLDRAIRFGKTVGCLGCDRIAECVKHTDACHERFRLCLEEERKKIAKETEEMLPLLPAAIEPPLEAAIPAGQAQPKLKSKVGSPVHHLTIKTFGSLTKKKDHGVGSILGQGKDCLLQLAMTILSMLQQLVQKG